MNRDEHKAILAEILGNPADTAKVSADLTRLSEDYGGMTADLELTRAENVALKAKNESVVKENMQLFLKIGPPVTEDSEGKPHEPKTYESLFNPDGSLK